MEYASSKGAIWSYSDDKKSSSSTATGLKNRPHGLVPKVKNEVKTKVQKLKDTRDYSFLLTDDAELPAPTKELAPRNVFARNSEARSAQVPQKIKQASSNSGRNIHGIREEGKPVFRNAQIHSKVGSQKPASANKLDAASINSKRQRGTLEEEIDAFQKFTAPIGAAPIALVKIDRGLLGMARLGSNRLVDPPG
ncbi:hypothetical protein OIU84_016706 [Salix udensis]|uniref:Uncharacterized protein n=1 Tax=Salix udensis TaxID=889485 RepID=A0AAD6JAE4_9ROSI|nr:hypothetical protein OIU84_016706 [Salix udensis]